jgi:hypothetical protein
VARNCSVARCLAAGIVLSVVASGTLALAGTIDFEGLSDQTDIGSTYSGLGVIFTNAVTISAGISLNEFEFPPHSGVSVAADSNAGMILTFSVPITSFQGYFTYASALSLVGSLSGSTVSTANSLFASNFVSSGNSPNEFLQLTSAGGIDQITVTGDPNGGSFVVDDISFSAASIVVTPEPAAWVLVGAGLIGVCVRRSLAARKN